MGQQENASKQISTSNAKQASTNVNKARKQRESSEWADVSKQANA